jgi:S-formylglutathione hydrolase
MPEGWTREQVGGKWADVYSPAEQPRFGLLYLHSYGLETLRDRTVFARLNAEHQLACVCPHGMRCWWADRVCREFDRELTPERHLLDNVLPFFASRWGIEPRGVALLGVSMGGQGAMRLAFKRPDLFPIVAAMAPAVDCHEVYGQGTPLDEMYDSKEQCRQDTAPMHLHPSRHPRHIFYCVDPDDNWHRGCDRLHEKMKALGVEHQVDLATRAGGHSHAYFAAMADRVFRFLVDALEQESLRLL